MAAVITELLISIGLDASKFNAEQKVAVNTLKQFEAQALRSGKQVESAAKTMLQAFNRAKIEVLSFSAALLGAAGFKDLLVKATSVNAAMGRFSEIVGLNEKDLNKWQNMAVIAGGSAEGMRATIFGLVKDLAGFRLFGTQPEWNFWSKLDLDKFVDAKGKIKDISQFMLAISNAMKGMTEGERIHFTEAFKIPTENIPLYNQTSTQLKDMLEDQEKLGVITTEMSNNSRDLAKNWHETAQSAEFLANVVLDKMTKDMIEILKLAKELLSNLSHGGRLMAYIRDPVGAATTDIMSYLGIPTATPLFPEGPNLPEKFLGRGALMSDAFTGGAGSPRPKVPSSKTVIGDDEAVRLGLYEKPTMDKFKLPGRSYASQVSGAGRAAAGVSTSTINNSRTFNFGGFNINAPNITDPKAVADLTVKGIMRSYLTSSQSNSRI